jgi:hypothetical protein
MCHWVPYQVCDLGKAGLVVVACMMGVCLTLVVLPSAMQGSMGLCSRTATLG